MIPTYCPRCGKPLLPDARQCPFCGLETFVPGPPEASSSAGAPPPPGSWPPHKSPYQPQSGWGVPQPDQGSNKTIVIAGCLILAFLLFIVVPIAIFMLTASRLVDGIQDFGTFPSDLPFPSFFP